MTLVMREDVVGLISYRFMNMPNIVLIRSSSSGLELPAGVGVNSVSCSINAVGRFLSNLLNYEL